MSDTYHLSRDGVDYTLLVFGPYDITGYPTEWDVEVHIGHIEHNYNHSPELSYLGTVSVTRDTHIVSDTAQFAEDVLDAANDREFEPLFD